MGALVFSRCAFNDPKYIARRRHESASRL